MSYLKTGNDGVIARFRKRITGQAIRKGSLGFADQAVMSGVNFVLMITAARALGPAAFGVFTLLYTVLIFAQMLHESLVSSPHNVIGASKKSDDYRRYTTAVAVLQSALALTVGTVSLMAGVTALWLFDAAVGSMLLAMAFATVAWQCHEFTRRVLYTESRFGAALVNDSLTHGGRLVLLGVLLVSIGLTGERIFLLFGATWSAGAALGLWQIRNSLIRQVEREDLHEVAREHWQFGRWLFGSNVVEQLPRYISAAVLSSVLSVSAFGAARAFGQLINGANLPLSSLSNLLRPRLAREAQHGTQAVWQMMMPVMLLGGMALAGFAAVLILLRQPLLGLIFGAEYVPYAAAMFLLTLTPMVMLQNYVLSIALQAFRMTRPIFIGTVLSAVVGPSVGTVALLVFGLPAAGAIGVTGACTSVLWLGWTWKKHSQREQQPVSDPQQVPETSVSNA